MPENGRTVVRSVGPDATTGAGSLTGPAGQAQRVRQSADAFAFDALLNGVTRAAEPDQVEEMPPHRDRPPAPSTESESPRTAQRPPVHLHATSQSPPQGRSSSPRDRPWLWAILLMATLAGTAAGVLVQSVMPHASHGNVSKTTAVVMSPLVMRGLPDTTLTPGELGPHTGEISSEVRLAVFRAYGVNPSDGRFVLCTLIPRSLGGSSASPNLFTTTRWFANLKARLDVALTARVAANVITTEEAVADLRANWVKAAHRHYVRNYGQRDPVKARTTEDQLNW